MIPEQVQQIAGNQIVIPTLHDGYYVTERGDIISTFVLGSNLRRIDVAQARMLKPQTINSGYQVVFLYRNGMSRANYVHHIVLTSFIGQRPQGHQACHNDGNRLNNCITNLRWDTVKANHIDSVNHGTHSRPPDTHATGERNGQSKFTEAQVRKIRELASQSIPQVEIGRTMGIGQGTISDIVRRKSWAWLE